ncbi:MAG: glycosyltransferase family 4 protein [Anaerolineales bacterium]|nr:glycosyltransferase family 4 protein [Anaerolineales bacterium]
MHISILHYAAPPIVGGVESTIYHHARLLFQAGYKISIYGGRGEAIDDGIPFILIPEIDSRHPSVMRIGEQLAKGEVSEEFYLLRDKLFISLSSSLKHSDILIVHNAITLHKNLALTAALKLIAEQRQPTLLAWCHDFAWQDTLYTPDLHPGFPWDLLKSAWEGVVYITVSDHRRQRLADLLDLQESNIQVIPPGVDVFQFFNLSPIAQEFIEQVQLLESEPIILLPARITRRKNIEFALQVTANLKKYYPKVALVITGPPGPHNPKNLEYLETLLKMRQSLGLITNIHFLYEFNGESEIFNAPDYLISELYRVADLVLFPSFREGFGIPVLEAGLARIPIFASDIPPVRESSAGMIKLFDPSDDPHHVADTINTELKSNRTFLFRRHVLNHFTWQSILRKRIIPLLEESGSSADD